MDYPKPAAHAANLARQNQMLATDETQIKHGSRKNLRLIVFLPCLIRVSSVANESSTRLFQLDPEQSGLIGARQPSVTG